MGNRTKWCCVYSLGTHVTMYIFAPFHCVRRQLSVRVRGIHGPGLQSSELLRTNKNVFTPGHVVNFSARILE